MRRRLIAAFAGVILAALWAAPAVAMSTPVFLQAPSSGKGVTGSVPIKVESKPAALLVQLEEVYIEVTINPRSGTTGSPINLGKRQGSIYEASWNAGAVPLNGAYDITAVATSSLDSPKSATVDNVIVNNPPSPPAGVKAALNGDKPSISWNANPEKDITAYKVLRSVAGSSYEQVATGPNTSYTDGSAPHSKALTYKVVAVRRSLVTPAGIESSSGPTSPLTIPAPAAPAEPGQPGPGQADPNKPTVPGTNIVTGKESPKAPLPGTNKNFGRAIAPIVKSAPAGTSFNETLPYSGVPPEQFEAAGGGDPSPLDAGAQAGAGDIVTVTNPLKFIVGGLLLLVASGFMWRASRRLLKGTRLPEGTPPVVKYPVFRITRG